MPKSVGKTFSNKQIGARVCAILIMIMKLEQSILIHQKKNLTSKVQYFHTVKFINLLGHLLMERRTTKLTTF
jgi:hypothetical protein